MMTNRRPHQVFNDDGDNNDEKKRPHQDWRLLVFFIMMAIIMMKKRDLIRIDSGERVQPFLLHQSDQTNLDHLIYSTIHVYNTCSVQYSSSSTSVQTNLDFICTHKISHTHIHIFLLSIINNNINEICTFWE